MSTGFMVLCAGLGQRLRPLTDRLPKPALPVVDAPLLRRHFLLARSAGATLVTINTHHLPEVMRSCAEREAEQAGLGLDVSHEPQIQGTAGGIREALAGHGHDLLVVMNGDTLFDIDLVGAIRAHRASGASATMVLAPLPASETYAAVECDRVMRVRRIAGEGPGGQDLAPWHFTGVHLISADAFFMFVPKRGPADINREVYPDLIDAGRVVAGHVDTGYWSDIGTPARLLGMHLDFLAGRVPAAMTLGAQPVRHGDARVAADARLVSPFYIGPGAQIGAGAVVGPGAFVGRAAIVGAGATIRNAAVLSGTSVTEREAIEGQLALGELRVPTTSGTEPARR